MKAPFPWFGGKRRVAHIVWERFGAAPTDKLYTNHDNELSGEVRKWAVEHGGNPKMRIALCGYEGEHEMPENWACISWKANGGYGNQSSDGNGNATRERIWFSPHCLRPVVEEPAVPFPDDRPAPAPWAAEQLQLLEEL